MGEGERLGLLINHLKTNAFQFSKHTKISQGSVSSIINGKRRMSRDIIDQISKAYPSINIDWLLKGAGEMFIQLPEDRTDITNEPIVDNSTIKLTIGTPEDGFPDEETMKEIISENLRIAGKRWKFTQSEMLKLLGGGVGKGGASTYFRGDTLPRLPLLLRLERLTGWSLVVLATKKLNFDQVPPAPLVDAPVEPSRISHADAEELKNELHRLRLRLGRIIEQIENVT